MPDDKTDILFLHVPKLHSYYRPLGDYMFILYIPVGLLGVADQLDKNGFKTRIVHLGIEREKRGKIDLARILEDYKPKVVALDLHWHFQSYDAIQVAESIKKLNPDMPVLLGGLTASCFAEEIMERHACIDYIIRGEAEVPCVDFMREFQGERDFSKVPNLVFRDAGQTQMNDVSFVADENILSATDYTNFSFIEDSPKYVEMLCSWMTIEGLSRKSQAFLLREEKGYPVIIGRGCVNNCYYCGGSQAAQKKVVNRKGISFRSVPAILESIRDIEQAGFDFAMIEFDPLPTQNADRFYRQLFSEIKSMKTRLNFLVERWRLPSDDFLQSFKDCLGEDSRIHIALNSQNKEVRRKTAMDFFDNEELEECLERIEKKNVKCTLFFTFGMPEETHRDLIEMIQYQKALKKRFKSLSIKTWMIEIEPGSCLSQFPEKFNVVPERITFADYYNYHGIPERNHFEALGYIRKGCMSESQLIRFRCFYMCPLFKLKYLAPFFCISLVLARKLGFYRILNWVMDRVRPGK